MQNRRCSSIAISKLTRAALRLPLLRPAVAMFVLASATAAVAADAIQFVPEKKLWVIQAGDETYALGINERDELQTVYWGERLRTEDLAPAHSLSGWSSFEPTTAATPQE